MPLGIVTLELSSSPLTGRVATKLRIRPSLYSPESSPPRGDSPTCPAASRSWRQRGTCPWLQARALGTVECCPFAADKRRRRRRVHHSAAGYRQRSLTNLCSPPPGPCKR